MRYTINKIHYKNTYKLIKNIKKECLKNNNIDLYSSMKHGISILTLLDEHNIEYEMVDSPIFLINRSTSEVSSIRNRENTKTLHISNLMSPTLYNIKTILIDMLLGSKIFIYSFTQINSNTNKYTIRYTTDF